MEEIDSKVEETRKKGDESSDTLRSLRIRLEELCKEMTSIAENVKSLEYSVVQVESKVKWFLRHTVAVFKVR